MYNANRQMTRQLPRIVNCEDAKNHRSLIYQGRKPQINGTNKWALWRNKFWSKTKEISTKKIYCGQGHRYNLQHMFYDGHVTKYTSI